MLISNKILDWNARSLNVSEQFEIQYHNTYLYCYVAGIVRKTVSIWRHCSKNRV